MQTDSLTKKQGVDISLSPLQFSECKEVKINESKGIESIKINTNKVKRLPNARKYSDLIKDDPNIPVSGQ
jgi:hypothetical protein